MKSSIKKLANYPVTVTSGVYLDGTSKTLQQAINDGDIGGNTNALRSYSSKLIAYKGEFDYSNYGALKTSGSQGDFWIWKGDSIIDFDTCWVAYPGDIVYLDGEYFKTIHIKQTNNIQPKTKYDVCIVGGGAGGIGAGYALKDAGYRVCMVEKLDTLGGTHCNAGVGLLIASPICDWYKEVAQAGFDAGKLNFINNGNTDKLANEVGEGTPFEKRFRASQFTDHGKSVINGYMGNHISINDAWYSQKYYDDFSPSIDVFINHELIKTHSDITNKKVDYITVKNSIDGNEFDIVADYFLDCSGDGALFTNDENLALDTDYYVGTDGRTRFGETVYNEIEVPNKYGINTVEPCYFQVFRRYISGYKFPNLATNIKSFTGIIERSNFEFTSPGSNSNITTVSNSYGTQMSLQKFIDYPNGWNMGDGYDRAKYIFIIGGYTAGNRFAGTRKMLAIREKYRVACEKTVDQNYLTTQITSSNYTTEKTIALSTWYVDIHNQSYSCVSNIANGVPYEAMIPKCYKNVLVASRCYGASHIGLSSVRLVRTMMDLGHSAGIAIKQLLDNGTWEEDVRNVDVAQVQANIGIANIITELETHFYGGTVTYTVATS